MSCVHSGNDQDDNGGLKFTEQQISEMMTEYILPLGKKYIEMKMDAGSLDNFWKSLDDYSDELLRCNQ